MRRSESCLAVIGGVSTGKVLSPSHHMSRTQMGVCVALVVTVCVDVTCEGDGLTGVRCSLNCMLSNLSSK